MPGCADDGDGTSEASSTGAASSDVGSSSDAGSTGATSSIGDGVCGDGLLDPGEVCDRPGDGCDASCQYIDRTVWTVTRGGPDRETWIYDIAIDPAGQIIVLGATAEPMGYTGWLLALDAQGGEQWQVTLPPEALDTPFQSHLAVSADGIFIQGYGVYQFSPKGEAGWYTWPPYHAFTTLTVADGAVYAGGAEFSADTPDGDQLYRFVLSRIDANTGDVVWDRIVGDDMTSTIATSVAVTGDTVLAMGQWSSLTNDSGGGAQVAVDAATGSSGSLLLSDIEEYPLVLGALPKGDLMLAGFAPNGLFVRRFTLAGEVRWTAALALEAQLGEMAVAPDEGAVLVGKISTAVGPHGFLQGVSSAGAAAWTLGYAPEDPANGVIVSGAAFGPDFFVAAGQEYRSLDQGGTAWIRRIDLEGVMP